MAASFNIKSISDEKLLDIGAPPASANELQEVISLMNLACYSSFYETVCMKKLSRWQELFNATSIVIVTRKLGLATLLVSISVFKSMTRYDY